MMIKGCNNTLKIFPNNIHIKKAPVKPELTGQQDLFFNCEYPRQNLLPGVAADDGGHTIPCCDGDSRDNIGFPHSRTWKKPM
jgi:hypothetical protein